MQQQLCRAHNMLVISLANLEDQIKQITNPDILYSLTRVTDEMKLRITELSQKIFKNS